MNLQCSGGGGGYAWGMTKHHPFSPLLNTLMVVEWKSPCDINSITKLAFYVCTNVHFALQKQNCTFHFLNYFFTQMFRAIFNIISYVVIITGIFRFVWVKRGKIRATIYVNTVILYEFFWSEFGKRGLQSSITVVLGLITFYF